MHATPEMLTSQTTRHAKKKKSPQDIAALMLDVCKRFGLYLYISRCLDKPHIFLLSQYRDTTIWFIRATRDMLLPVSLLLVCFYTQK
jgi:hypothetical protein